MRLKFLFYTAAVSIGLAGVQHLIDLVIDPEHSGNISIATFFIIAGVAQIFGLCLLPNVGENLGTI